MDPFEDLAARSVAAAIERCPPDLHPLIFASPICTRSSDVSLLWHPGYRNRHKLRLLLQSLFSLPIEALKGLVKLFPPFRRFTYALSGKITGSLLVVPGECGSDYIETNPEDAVYVFWEGVGKGKTNSPRILGGAVGGKKLPINLSADILRPFVFLARATPLNNPLLTLSWLSWLLSLRWLIHRALHQNLTSLVQRYRPSKIGCIHEMHHHSRIVWHIASQFGATTYTLQHAAFSPGKRWLFPHAVELAAGLRTPDVFYVFTNSVAQMLSPFYPHTTFLLGASHRYISIKNKTVGDERSVGSEKNLGQAYSPPGIGGVAAPSRKSRGATKAGADGMVISRYYLFATALPWFDNAVVLTAARRIIGGGLPVRVRLHPQAKLTLGFSQSSNSLEDDLSSALLVIGMGSTVLEEAIALGIRVIQLTHSGFLEYLDLSGLPGVTRIHHSDFSDLVLERAQLSRVDSAQARHHLGLDNPEITYDLLFSTVAAVSGRRRFGVETLG